MEEVQQLQISKNNKILFDLIQIRVFDLSQSLQITSHKLSFNHIKQTVEKQFNIFQQTKRIYQQLKIVNLYELMKRISHNYISIATLLIQNSTQQPNPVKVKEQKKIQKQLSSGDNKQNNQKKVQQVNVILKEIKCEKKNKLGGISLYNQSYQRHTDQQSKLDVKQKKKRKQNGKQMLKQLIYKQISQKVQVQSISPNDEISVFIRQGKIKHELYSHIQYEKDLQGISKFLKSSQQDALKFLTDTQNNHQQQEDLVINYHSLLEIMAAKKRKQYQMMQNKIRDTMQAFRTQNKQLADQIYAKDKIIQDLEQKLKKRQGQDSTTQTTGFSNLLNNQKNAPDSIQQLKQQHQIIVNTLTKNLQTNQIELLHLQSEYRVLEEKTNKKDFLLVNMGSQILKLKMVVKQQKQKYQQSLRSQKQSTFFNNPSQKIRDLDTQTLIQRTFNQEEEIEQQSNQIPRLSKKRKNKFSLFSALGNNNSLSRFIVKKDQSIEPNEDKQYLKRNSLINTINSRILQAQVDCDQSYQPNTNQQKPRLSQKQLQQSITSEQQLQNTQNQNSLIHQYPSNNKIQFSKDNIQKNEVNQAKTQANGKKNQINAKKTQINVQKNEVNLKNDVNPNKTSTIPSNDNSKKYKNLNGLSEKIQKINFNKNDKKVQVKRQNGIKSVDNTQSAAKLQVQTQKPMLAFSIQQTDALQNNVQMLYKLIFSSSDQDNSSSSQKLKMILSLISQDNEKLLQSRLQKLDIIGNKIQVSNKNDQLHYAKNGDQIKYQSKVQHQSKGQNIKLTSNISKLKKLNINTVNSSDNKSQKNTPSIIQTQKAQQRTQTIKKGIISKNFAKKLHHQMQISGKGLNFSKNDFFAIFAKVQASQILRIQRNISQSSQQSGQQEQYVKKNLTPSISRPTTALNRDIQINGNSLSIRQYSRHIDPITSLPANQQKKKQSFTTYNSRNRTNSNNIQIMNQMKADLQRRIAMKQRYSHVDREKFIKEFYLIIKSQGAKIQSIEILQEYLKGNHISLGDLNKISHVLKQGRPEDIQSLFDKSCSQHKGPSNVPCCSHYKKYQNFLQKLSITQQSIKRAKKQLLAINIFNVNQRQNLVAKPLQKKSMRNLDYSYNYQSIKSIIEKSGKYGSESFHFQNKRNEDKLVKRHVKKIITQSNQDLPQKKKYCLPQLNKKQLTNIRS